MCRRRTAGSNAQRRWLLPAMMILAVTGCSSPSASPAAPSAGTSPQPPPGTSGIGVAGSVSDAAFRPLAGATVQVSDGAGAGASTTTNSRGEFRLFGNFDQTTQFRALSDGHTAVIRPLPEECAPCNPHWWIHFSLESAAPHPDLSGHYTLTFLADDRCVGLPDELRTRTFDASITRSSRPDSPANPRFDVTVHGVLTVDGSNRFAIGVAGDYLGAAIGDWGHNGAGLVERLGTNTYVSIAGDLSATVASTSVISGRMHGAVGRCELPREWTSAYDCGGLGTPPTARCVSENHQLVMRRH